MLCKFEAVDRELKASKENAKSLEHKAKTLTEQVSL